MQRIYVIRVITAFTIATISLMAVFLIDNRNLIAWIIAFSTTLLPFVGKKIEVQSLEETTS
ncbi:hypothetical protein CAI16_06960 [Virgibacillus dokdonensis]|uniref:Uncharacterized protein n=1 Tax=Virgibacillus dokdonensis TaxID=302167 RepID=A0A3E0WTS2_9BACI|nr:hypothetical protein [Virgibacillus dokdonensis]RFA35789.1 hypothetical protein CAI16_06960 [Virgibacillus dokdonensis]